MFSLIMNRLDLLAKSYSQLHNYQGIPYWAISPFRKIVRFVAHKVLPSYLAKSKLSHGVHRSGLLVSFTSFPTRANDVWKVVELIVNTNMNIIIYVIVTALKIPINRSLMNIYAKMI